MERNCDGCTACCKTHGIFEIQKMPGDCCPHCEIGTGCKIYSKRPKECQSFKCAWLLGIGGPNHRPDKMKMVPEHREIPGIGISMWFWELSAGSLNSRLVRNWTLRNLLLGNCVMHVSLDANDKLFLPQRIKDLDRCFVVEGSQKIVDIVRFPEWLSQLS